MKYVRSAKVIDPQTTVVTCEGEMDSLAVEELHQAVDPLLADSTSHLIFDFAKVDYISSSVLSFLLATQGKAKEKSGKVSLVGASALVKQSFEMAALDSLFEFRGTLEDAGVVVTSPFPAKGKERAERKGKGITTKEAKPPMRVVEEKVSLSQETGEQEKSEGNPVRGHERRTAREVEKIQPLAERRSWRDYDVWIGIGVLVAVGVGISCYLYMAKP